MVQLRILSGAQAGDCRTVRDFPFLIGRAASAGLRLQEGGVWDEHLRLELHPREGFVLTVAPNARAQKNGEPFERTLVRNGDVIELGAAKFQFWLSQTRQRSFRARETLTWIGLAILCASQVFIIYQLLR